eukprot:scaffold8444_cov102-Isochrysis_galbana.AAC.1
MPEGGARKKPARGRPLRAACLACPQRALLHAPQPPAPLERALPPLLFPAWPPPPPPPLASPPPPEQPGITPDKAAVTASHSSLNAAVARAASSSRACTRASASSPASASCDCNSATACANSA